MKLEKYYADIEDNEGNWEWCDVVKWTPELQEAWDKQQEMELGEYYTCSQCNYICFSDYEDDYKYCPNCGQKIKV